MSKYHIIATCTIVVLCGSTYAQECKILETESYAKPLFSLSRFHNACEERKYEAEATWTLTLVQNNKSVTLEQLQPEKATFEVVKSADSIYDCSTKTYSLSSKKFAVRYSNYANSDALSITFDGNTYEVSTIDGGCDTHLGQLCQRYRDNGGKETLVLTAIDDIMLDRSLTLKRGSTIAFTVSY